MKRLVIQTFYPDSIDRGHKFTYAKFPKLEQASRRHFRTYAEMIDADYEYFTDVANFEHGDTAHWQRWEFLNRPNYDEVLYVDCDVLIHPDTFKGKHNIFDFKGVGVPLMHPSSISKCGFYGGVNAGIVKLTAEECAVMKDKIHDYYHPHINQPSFNRCYVDNFGMFENYLPIGWNHTHYSVPQTFFRHYAGGQKSVWEQEKLWKNKY